MANVEIQPQGSNPNPEFVYGHVTSAVVGAVTPSVSRVTPNQRVCRFFLRGSCLYGEDCYYSHNADNTGRNNQKNRNISSQMHQKPSQQNNAENSNQPSTSGRQIVDNSSIKNNQQPLKADKTEKDKHSPSETSSNNDKKKAVSATKSGSSCMNDGACSPPEATDEWVNAPEFIPKSSVKLKSYAEVAISGEVRNDESNAENVDQKLCPYALKDGFCKYPAGECQYLHGNPCELCGCAALHPFNEELRKKHNQECIKQHEKDMELSFAIARSKEKTCGVCFEVIMEKTDREQRFGILPNCNHCFCLSCIRKWRQAKQFENNIIRACPECRVTSDFVCPSMYWVDTKEDKDKLIADYKKALAKKDCKYFKNGSGKCPFGNKCFYLHAFPDGRKCDVGPPQRQRRRRNPLDNDIEVLQQVILWDFLDERDNPWNALADDLEDLVDFFTDSEDSDWSDYDLLFD